MFVSSKNTMNSCIPLAEKYCHLFLCVHCLKENVACTQNGQCCEGQCTYGRCKAGVTEGQPGTFCDRHEDCAGEGKAACCVRLVFERNIAVSYDSTILACCGSHL